METTLTWGASLTPNPQIGPTIPFDGLADNSTAIAFYAEEDGSAQLAVIPEPATMLLLGSGLIGLGVFGRRKKKI
ncbi:MAG: VPLPA-CTERM sorting domain-containing protein [Deltaproteobacteria bacterium]|nr:VPLPA-CTERM sorting domain-containing protein [Deltaproteobacteria bacterium]